MDVTTLRSFAVVLVAIAFIVICWWAFAPSRKKRFEEAANLPFADEPKKQGDAEVQNQQEDTGDEGLQSADHKRGQS